MSGATHLKRTYVEGREDQFNEMMQELTNLGGKYKGVRGELLAKVRSELAKLKPTANRLSVVSAPVPVEAATTSVTANPSCRVCGRETKLNATDGRLVCQNGHTR
jgi:hypothetical protein